MFCIKLLNIQYLYEKKGGTMNIILLSGGSGKKLWPLSNDVRSKQFIKLFKNADGKNESMIQRIFRQITNVDKDAVITVATSKSQASTVINQLGNSIGISVEPDRRNTFPAVALAVEYLKDVKGVAEDEPIVVCPVDLFVEDSFFLDLERLGQEVKNHSGIILFGSKPTEARTQYGYIIPENDSKISKVKSFIEKPDLTKAEELIKNGALWNAGIFAFEMKYFLNLVKTMITYDGYDDLFNNYSEAEAISFDHAVVEKCSNMHVMKTGSVLNDLGTWESLTKAMEENVIGNALLSDTCNNVNIINDMDIPILAVGLEDIVISASQQGVLVTHKNEMIDITPYVDRIDQQVMFADKSWGSLKVLDASDKSMTIRLNITAGKRMSYHSHEYRDEMWTILSGTGKTIVDGMEQPVKAGDVITMEAGCRHTIIADTNLEVIEIQRGSEISTSDKKKFELE